MPLFPQQISIAKLKMPELLAIDVASSGAKCLRARFGKNDFTITEIGVLSLDECFEAEEGGEGERGRLSMPKKWITNYAAFCLTGETSIIRYVSLPGQAAQGAALDTQLREHMGLEGDYRLASVIIDQARKKTETRLLTAAMPEVDAQALLERTSVGTPAPVSMEISCLSALNAFHSLGSSGKNTDESVGFIECGASTTLLALFNKGVLILVRKFNTGGNLLLSRVQDRLGVDRDVAEGIITDGSFDISQSVQTVMEPFLRQLSISKDFVERREACEIGKIYVAGGMSLCSYWVDCVRRTLGTTVEVWNPFDGLKMNDGAIPEELKGQEARFAAVTGAALGVFEQI